MYYPVQLWIAGQLHFDESYDNINEYVEAMTFIADQYSTESGFTVVVDISGS